MPTKRRKIGPRRINRETPAWARRYVEDGTVPEYGTDDHLQYVEWYFFGESVPGLPPGDSDEGQALKRRERERRAD